MFPQIKTAFEIGTPVNLFLGILIKRSAFAVGAMFVWLIVESITKGLLYWKLESSVELIMQFFPLESMSNLINQPGSRLNAVQTVAKQVGEDLTYDYAVHWYEIAIVLGWTAIFIFLSYRLLKKRDL